MSPIRVLIVDDSVVIRRIVSRALEGDRDIEVVGTAANGQIAVEKAQHLTPDVVVLDIEMPVMDGLSALQEIRRRRLATRVIMFSTLTQRGATQTLDALMHGANDYLTKPESGAGLASAIDGLRSDLIAKIKALGGGVRRSAKPSRGRDDGHSASTVRRVRLTRGRPSLLAIGSSTGGPNALATVFSSFKKPLPVPVVICQHMPPLFTARLAERLSICGPMPVKEARAGDRLVPGHALIAPGDYHLELTSIKGQLVAMTHQRPPEHSCRPAVDVLFRSVAKYVGARTLGVVLTGMGSDGALGCRAIADAGGEVIVQDEQTSIVWGMPGAVVQAEAAHAILPLTSIAHSIESRINQDTTRHLGSAKAGGM